MLLKDMYDKDLVTALGTAVQTQHPAFDLAGFISSVFAPGWDERELKQRTRHITTALHQHLALDYHSALDVLRGALPAMEGYGFAKMVFPDYVELYGMDDWPASSSALEEFTKQISAEFAIRPFIVRYPKVSMKQMHCWAEHPSAQVRRLSSEGCRPRLPWGIALPDLKSDPSPILPILEILKNDTSESVRRSVANNLNDITKDNPDIVLDLLESWQQTATNEVHWITSHALRSLIKQGNSQALELLGFPSDPAIAVHNLAVQPESVSMGGVVTLSFDIHSLAFETLNLMIDYVVYLLRANGKHTPKVFKLSKRSIDPGETLHIERKVSFRPVTTRRYYPGQHSVGPKINGQLFGRVEFALNPATTLGEP